jgi:hypothetical protein
MTWSAAVISSVLRPVDKEVRIFKLLPSCRTDVTAKGCTGGNDQLMFRTEKESVLNIFRSCEILNQLCAQGGKLA